MVNIDIIDLLALNGFGEKGKDLVSVLMDDPDNVICIASYIGYPIGQIDNDAIVAFVQVRVRGTDGSKIEKLIIDLYKFFKSNKTMEINGTCLAFALTSTPSLLTVDDRKRINYMFNMKITTTL